MAREHARVNLSIWQDPEFRALPVPAQHLYLTLWTHPGLSYCGVVDWRPGRLAAFSGGRTVQEVEHAAACLEARHFIVVDTDTEECLIRSWARFDGLIRQPHMAVSYANAYAEVASNDIRGVLIHETIKLRKIDAGLPGWGKPQVFAMLSLPAIDPRSRAVPEDPYGPQPDPPAQAPPDPALGLKGVPPSDTPPTPSPSPSPSPVAFATSAPGAPPAKAGRAAPRRRAAERPIPDDWKPNTSHQEHAEEHELDLSTEAFRFRNHAHSNDRRLRDWDAGFRNWLSKAQEFAASKPKERKPPPPLPVFCDTCNAPPEIGHYEECPEAAS